MMQNKKETLINISAALVTFIVQMFISFWLSPFVVSKLGEEAYGFINLANNFVSYASLVSVSVNAMACRFISVEYNSGKIEEAKKYFCSVFIVNCFLYIIIMLIALIFIGNIQNFINVSSQWVRQVKITFLFSFLNMGVSMIGTVYTAAAFTMNKMHKTSLVQVVSNIIKSILVFSLFMLLPSRIYFLSLATLIAGIITFIGNYIVTQKLFSHFNIKIYYLDFHKIIRLVKSGLWVLISNISNLLLNGFDLLLSNWFISSVIMGRLSLAKQIPLSLSSALGIFSNIFSSSLTRIYATDEKKDLIKEAQEQLKILTIIFSVPYAGIIIVGPEFLNLWLYNSHYNTNELKEIYILMILILLDIIISTYMYSIHSVFIALDKVRYYSIVLLIASFISIISTIILLKTTSLGVYAIAGTSTLILGITHAIIVPGMAAKMLSNPITIFWKSEIKSWILLGILCVIFKFIKTFMKFGSWIFFAENILILAFIGYLISVLFILNKSERKNLISFIKFKK